MLKSLLITLDKLLVISVVFSVTYVLPAVICCIIAYNKSLYIEMVTNTPYIIFFGVIAIMVTFFFMDSYSIKIKREQARKLKESDNLIISFSDEKAY